MENPSPAGPRLRRAGRVATRARWLLGASLLGLAALAGGTLAIRADRPAPDPVPYEDPTTLPQHWQWDPPTHRFDRMIRDY